MNFARDVIERRDPGDLAVVELSREGARREWTFGEVTDRAARLAGALQAHGVSRGDVVMTLIGNRPDWVLTMVACFRLGAVVLPCTEQLRAKDLRLRIDHAHPALIVADERNRAELRAAGVTASRTRAATGGESVQRNPGDDVPVLYVPDHELFTATPAPAVELQPSDPCLITFTSGTAGEPKAVVHAQRYLPGQRLQAEHWLGALPGDLVWCTAASGWSKSARNTFIAPWLSGAAALLHDARFDAEQRLALLDSERVNVLCMAPTEYRVIAKRTTLRPLTHLRGMVAAGEALNPEVLRAWQEVTGLEIRDGYGQTETGQLTGTPPGEDARPGSMGKALPGVGLALEDGELAVDPDTVPTFSLGYLDEHVRRDELGSWLVEDRRHGGPWPTGDRVNQDGDGWLYFEGRNDDVIVSAGYRIGPFEVESALVAHPAVAEAAAVAAPDEERGAVVRAVVVLRDGDYTPSPELVRELQEHVKRETAPYKYPRIVDFAQELPKTASGKVRRAELRRAGS
ncbi:MAG: AMP-dependent synthetase and ligase [Solirubrobacterales bacterium]|nr:AMP-dependent synthetase and ligase [Solirubrobacterales bacterium]